MTKNNPTRVLHTLAWATEGGVEQLRLLLAQNLPREAWSHTLICQGASASMIAEFRGWGWGVHEIGKARHILDLRWYLRAVRIAREFRPDVIHGSVFEGNALATVCGISLPRTPVILEEQSDGRGRSWRGKVLLWMMAVRATNFIGVAPEISSYLIGEVKVPQSKIITIANAARTPSRGLRAASQDLRRELGISPEALVVGSTGRLLEHHKKFSTLITALPHLQSKAHEIFLVIMGDGPDRELYKELISSEGLEGRVFLPGFRNDISPWLDVMDIFVLPSAGEALPLALVEAMHSELPCIATSVGGNPFVLDGGKAGILISPGSQEELILAITALLNSEKRRETLGKRALARASDVFSPARYAKDVSSLWNDCILRRR